MKFLISLCFGGFAFIVFVALSFIIAYIPSMVDGAINKSKILESLYGLFGLVVIFGGIGLHIYGQYKYWTLAEGQSTLMALAMMSNAVPIAIFLILGCLLWLLLQR